MALLLAVFAITFAVAAGSVALGFSYFKRKQKQQIRSMLHTAQGPPIGHRDSSLIKPADPEDPLAKFLRQFQFVDRLNLMFEQAGTKWTASKLLVVSATTTGIGFVLGLKLGSALPGQIGPLAGAALGAVSPFLLILRKRAKMFSDFEKQFPEALDFLSRSMRAGHAFSVALEMLAADAPDPVGSAFRRVSNDLALGSSMEVALKKLVTTMPVVDVRFFVSAVVLQQETGGNLGEILTKLAYIMRERFRLKGQVKAVSAHGRITGLVLLLMPIGVVIFVMLTNPVYLQNMAADPDGRKMIYGAIGGQIVGYFVIKKIISIKV